MLSFRDYLDNNFSSSTGTKRSYITAIKILDSLFAECDIFDLKYISLTEIRDPYLIRRIITFVADEEDKFRDGQSSIFDLGNPNQSSYPKNRFCTAAIRHVGRYINDICIQEAIQIAHHSAINGKQVSDKLLSDYKINEANTEKERQIKQRIGQDIFRAILLDIYESKCCLTGLDIPEVLRASHIIPWADKEETRLNPENGLCLSATYDAAFDKHLITFDEQYHMVLSPIIKEFYSSDAFKKYFLNFEGKKIMMPFKYSPSQEYMEKHREKLLV